MACGSCQGTRTFNVRGITRCKRVRHWHMKSTRHSQRYPGLDLETLVASASSLDILTSGDKAYGIALGKIKRRSGIANFHSYGVFRCEEMGPVKASTNTALAPYKPHSSDKFSAKGECRCCFCLVRSLRRGRRHMTV